jgi:superoxide dismutase, Cu-Zn family
MTILSHSSGALVVLGALLAACARAAGTGADRNSAVAELRDATGRAVGTATARPADAGGVAFHLQVSGLGPGAHGVHIHAIGTCDASTATAFASAGGHFNPTAKQHGRLNPAGWHAGDLPNIVVDSATGRGTLDAVGESLTLTSGPTSLLDADGSAIVVHANRDDERTDAGPAGPGNSGGRVACGVFRLAAP